MKVLDPGNAYELDNLRSEGSQILTFMKDEEIHGVGHQGTSCQEAIRAVIHRVQVLDKEMPAGENAFIVHHLRMAILGFETRALRRMVEKGLAIEAVSTQDNGHIFKMTEIIHDN